MRQKPATASLSVAEVRAIAVEAYVYLYPLLTMEVSRRQMTNLPAGERPTFGPMGVFSHARAFPGAVSRRSCDRTSTRSTRAPGST